MATLTEAPIAESIRERLTPAFETIDDALRRGRRAVAHGQQAAVDATDTAAIHIRRHPLAAVMVAGTAAALTGCVIGFSVGWIARGTGEP
jgi:ElaB/YqjD/DUF883 family membrane-anchored ribosome-binding protein